MQRQHILKIFLKGLAFTLFGNVLSGIMIISIAPMISVWFICLVAFLFTFFIYASLLFTAGWQDGTREKSLLKNHRVEASPKYRWIVLGLICGALISIPSIVLLLGKLGAVAISGEFMFYIFRFINGAVTPLLYIAQVHKEVAVTDFPLWLPLTCIGIYLIVSPLAAQIGYKFGFDEKTKESFMYEK